MVAVKRWILQTPTLLRTSSCGPYGANFARGAVGGEEEHTLTKAELPAQQIGTQTGDRFAILSDSGTEIIAGAASGYRFKFEWGTAAIGQGQAHNNMPPYLAQNIIVRAL